MYGNASSIISAEFARAGILSEPRLNFVAPSSSSSTTISLQDAKTWQDVFDLSATDFCDAMLRNLPNNPSITVNVGGDCGELVIIEADNDTYDFSFSIDIDDEDIYVSGGFVKEQGNGIGRIFLRNLVNYASYRELEKITIHAAGGNGAFSWAMMGIPLDPDHRNEEISKFLMKGFWEIQHYLPVLVEAELRKAIRLSDPDDINKIARMSFDVNTVLSAEMLDRTQGEYFIHLVEHYQNQGHRDETAMSMAENKISKIEDIQKTCKKQGVPFTLGRLMLVGGSYNGALDLHDHEAVNHVTAYSSKARRLMQPLCPATT